MRNLYEITNKNGVVLCFQVAKSEAEAVDFAKMYGHKSARNAEFIREVRAGVLCYT